jgi:hypothetical protein
MTEDQKSNLRNGIGLAISAIVISIFVTALMDAKAGEVAAALASVISGSFVVAAAAIAWRSVQQQIASQEKIEAGRRSAATYGLESGFTSELFVYSRGVIQAASIWNQRAIQNPQTPVSTNWPVYIDPLYYRTNIGKIGLVRNQWVIGAIIGFYSNVLELNEQAREAMSGRPTADVTTSSIAARLRIMASSLSQALDGLNDDRKFPIPHEIQLDKIFMPDGRTVSQSEHLPQNLQDVLLRLAEIAAVRAAKNE